MRLVHKSVMLSGINKRMFSPNGSPRVLCLDGRTVHRSACSLPACSTVPCQPLRGNQRSPIRSAPLPPAAVRTRQQQLRTHHVPLLRSRQARVEATGMAGCWPQDFRHTRTEVQANAPLLTSHHPQGKKQVNKSVSQLLFNLNAHIIVKIARR